MADFINSTNRNPSIFSDIGNTEKTKTQTNKKLDVKNSSSKQDTVELNCRVRLYAPLL